MTLTTVILFVGVLFAMIPITIWLSDKITPAFTTLTADVHIADVFSMRTTEGTFRWPFLLQAKPLTVIHAALIRQRMCPNPHKGIPFWLSQPSKIVEQQLTEQSSYYVLSWQTTDPASVLRLMTVYSEKGQLTIWEGHVALLHCQQFVQSPIQAPQLIFAHCFPLST